MTDKQKLDALKMLLEGATYAEVGKKYMVSRERIRQMFSGVVGERRQKRKESVYPQLAEWIANNCETYAKFATKIGASEQVVSLFMNGKSRLYKETIDKILVATGMTCEECFAKEKAPEEAATSIKG